MSQPASINNRSANDEPINEAFAAMAIAVMKDLGLPEDIVTGEGGALAHGHPIGASGPVLATRILHSMRRDGVKRGVVTLCIGGGQRIALALEVMKGRRAPQDRRRLHRANGAQPQEEAV